VGSIGRLRGTVAAIALAAAGCGDGLTDTERDAGGAYALVAINGLPLPFELSHPCGERAIDGFLQLGQENRFFVDVTILNSDCPDQNRSESWSGSGIWTVIEGDIRLVSDDGIQAIRFGSAPAPLGENELRAEGTLSDPRRPTLQPVEVTFTFVR